MSSISWIKLSVNMFDDEKIKLIRSLPEGNSIILVWVQLLSVAGKTNDDGMIYIGRNLAYSDEMLATIFDHPLSTIRLALRTLEDFELIETNPKGIIRIANWEKHQNVEGMERIREQTRKRVARHREKKQKESFENDVTLPETLRNATDKNRLDKNRLDKEIMSSSDEQDDIPYKEVVDYLNEITGSKYRHTTASTKRFIKTRFGEGFTLEDFKKVIDVKTKDWLRDKSMKKYLRPETLFGNKFEGYLNETNVKQKKHVNSFTEEEIDSLPF